MSDALMIEMPDVTALPDPRYLPKNVRKLLDERDAVFGRWLDLESDHADITASNWRELAEARDQVDAAAAIVDGRDPFEGTSHVERAERLRPRVAGALRTLAGEVRRAEHALKAAARAELPAIVAAIGADLRADADAYIEAQHKADEARGKYGAMLKLRQWSVAWQFEGSPDCATLAEATPVTMAGHAPVDYHNRPVPRGAAEVQAIAASYAEGGVPDLYGVTGEPVELADPTVQIRSLVNGSVLNVPASHAAAHVASGKAEFVDDSVNV